jgi:hypothetical protein
MLRVLPGSPTQTNPGTGHRSFSCPQHSNCPHLTWGTTDLVYPSVSCPISFLNVARHHTSTPCDAALLARGRGQTVPRRCRPTRGPHPSRRQMWPVERIQLVRQPRVIPHPRESACAGLITTFLRAPVHVHGSVSTSSSTVPVPECASVGRVSSEAPCS